jgi:hypothetical protein
VHAFGEPFVLLLALGQRPLLLQPADATDARGGAVSLPKLATAHCEFRRGPFTSCAFAIVKLERGGT